MSDDTRSSVEAVLLNSNEPPNDVIVAALKAVAEFAYLEVDATEEQFMKAVRSAWRDGTERAKMRGW